MLITLLELSKFKRLSLNAIDFIRITPKNKLILILGTNGSGKSSLMKELCPLPATSTDYHKGGYKLIEITKGLSKYVLRSSFEGAARYSFIKDGEELNPGGTVTVYKDLVKKEFNITPEVHELLTGVLQFHNMSVSERRNWFTKISDTDYTYALGYYQRLKNELNNYQGALKIAQPRLVQESSKLLTPEDERNCRSELIELHTMLNNLLEIKQPIVVPSQSVKDVILSNMLAIGNMTKEVFRLKAKFPNTEGFLSVKDIQEQIGITKNQCTEAERSMSILTERIDKLDKNIEILKATGNTTSAELDKHMSDILEEIDQVYKQLRYTLHFENHELALQALNACKEDVVTTLENLPVNTDRSINREYYLNLGEAKNKLSVKIQSTKNVRDTLELQKKELEHQRDHGKSECPRCSFVWYKEYTPEAYAKICKQLEIANTRIAEDEAEYAKIDKQHTEAYEYLSTYAAYAKLTSAWSQLKPIWDYLLKSDKIFTSPASTALILDEMRIDLLCYIKIDKLKALYKEKDELKALIGKNQITDIAKVQEESAAAHSEFNRNQQVITSGMFNLRTYDYYLTTIETIKDLEYELSSCIKQQESKTNELVSVYKSEAINQIIHHIKLEISQREQLISRVDIQKALVSNIETQIREYSDKVEVLKIAVQELSPSAGLIAKSMSGFINHFVRRCNSFIKKIWLYPLELVPITASENDELDLDYKFSVKIADNLVVSDIAKGSSAMREVIDLAYRITSMYYLGLKEAPIFADELGISFDKAHRQSVFNAVIELLTSSNFSQIFMISHYENTYGCLVNSDVVVLCSQNIGLPKDTPFNTIVEMH